MLELTIRREPGVIHFKLIGELDVDTVGYLREKAIPSPGTKLFLDLRELRFVDSSGLRGLLDIYRVWEGRVTLGHVRPEVQEILEVVGLAELFRQGEEGENSG